MNVASGPGADARWLVLITTLPVDDPSGRMKVLRMFETLGMALLREGVYLLPDAANNDAGLRRLVDHIERMGGTAYLLRATTSEPQETKRLRALFDRSERYSEIIKTVDGMKAAFGVSDPTAIAKVLAKLRRDLETIGEHDFFPSPLAAKAEAMLASSEDAVRKLMFPDAPEQPAAPVRDRAGKRKFFRRAWATRRPLFVDRLASAWLIRRFIDAEATLVWLDKGTPCPATAIGFGYDGAQFRSARGNVTYEELLAHFALDGNPALAKIGRLVHALDAGDTDVAEAAGVETLLAGARRRAQTDDELLAESEKTFDLLYEAYFEVPAKKP